MYDNVKKNVNIVLAALWCRTDQPVNAVLR